MNTQLFHNNETLLTVTTWKLAIKNQAHTLFTYVEEISDKQPYNNLKV